MSIMTILRRAFGFSPDTEEEEGEYDPTVPTYAVTNQDPVPASPDSGDDGKHQQCEKSEAVPAPDPQMTDEKLPADIFDAVIEIFNRAQPEFVRECLNVEAQRQYILNSLSESLRGRVSMAISSGSRKWEMEKVELEKRISDLEGDDNEIARLRKDNKRLQFSVDRQKRAMLDRINDLETQVARQTEEKERFYSRKHAPESEELGKALSRVKELEEQTAKLSDEIAELKSAPAPEQPAGGEEPVNEDLKAEMEQDRADFEQQKSAWIDEKTQLTSELESMRAEVTRQKTLKEQLEVKTSISDAMINDLRNQVASARSELEKLQQEQEQVMEQIREQLDGFEDLKARKDAKITELQESNNSLRRTIETNLYNQANSEMKLRREIKDLKAELARLTEEKSKEGAQTKPNDASQTAVSPMSAPDAGFPTEAAAEETKASDKPARRRGRPKKVRIDHELDNTEWFAGSGKQQHDDPDFGYHEPPRRPVNDNEAQLSLF